MLERGLTEALGSSQEIYSSSVGSVRMTFHGDVRNAGEVYSDYVNFVQAVAPANGAATLLDVGCGCGWSSYFFADAGYEATGIDLNPSAFEPPSAKHLTLSFGSMLNIPFSAEYFDTVATYQCLEHVPEPQRGLEEMERVLRPGGTIIVVGPNLVSPFLPLKFLCRDLSTGRALWRRTPSTPKHPYGNTVAENLFSIVSSTIKLMLKLLSRKVTFCMRIPDSLPPFHGDNDACYFCNPTDLKRYFEARGYTKVRNGKPGRLPGSWLFAGGTWVAYRKP